MSSERPSKKKFNFTVPIDAELEQRGLEKAQSSKSLRRILRAIFFLWASGDYPDPPAAVVEQTSRRAKKTPRKKQS